MTLEPREYHASIATIKVLGGGLVEIHYHPGIVFSVANVAEVQQLRRRVMGNTPYATLTFIPEDVDFQMETMQHDHGRADRTESQLLASAVVAQASMMELLTKLWFSYFPQLHRILVTDSEAKARLWMAAQLEEISKTGS